MAHGAKHRVLSRIYAKFRVRPAEVISVGDSEGDIPLARNSGYSIAFNSSSKALSGIVDYNCRTRDFREVFRKIMEISCSSQS
jgi:phosphoserine phosphatase